jgi:hypothetical protein
MPTKKLAASTLPTLPSITDSGPSVAAGTTLAPGDTFALSAKPAGSDDSDTALGATQPLTALAASGLGETKVRAVGRLLVMLRKIISAETMAEVTLLSAGVRAECDGLEMPEVAKECNLMLEDCGKLRAGHSDRCTRNLGTVITRHETQAGLAHAKATSLEWDAGVCRRQTARRKVERDQVVKKLEDNRQAIFLRDEERKQPLEDRVVESAAELERRKAMAERAASERAETKKLLVERGRRAKEMKTNAGAEEAKRIKQRDDLTMRIHAVLEPKLKKRTQELVDEIAALENAKDAVRACRESGGFRKEEVTAELIRYGEWEERLAKEHALHMETARQKYNDTEARLTAKKDSAVAESEQVEADLEAAEGERDATFARLADAEDRLEKSQGLIARIHACEEAEKVEAANLARTHEEIEAEKEVTRGVRKVVAELARWKNLYAPRERTTAAAVKAAEGFDDERFAPEARHPSTVVDGVKMSPQVLAAKLRHEADVLQTKIKQHEESRQLARDRAVALETEWENLTGMYRRAVEKVVADDAVEKAALEAKHASEMQAAADRLGELELRTSRTIANLEVTALTQQRRAAYTLEYRSDDADKVVADIQADLDREVARLTKHCEEVLSQFDAELREKTKQVGVRVKSAKEEAVQCYSLMREEEAKVKMMEKNLIDMTQQLQELRDGMSAAEAEAEDSKRIAAELTQKLADREHFWNDQHTQIKNTVGKEVAEVRARLEGELEVLKSQLLGFPEQLQFLTDLHSTVESNVKDATKETASMEAQVDELAMLEGQLTTQIRRATPRGKLASALGSTELHIWRLQQGQVIREHGEEIEAVLDGILSAEKPLESLVDPEVLQMTTVQALLADSAGGASS